MIEFSKQKAFFTRLQAEDRQAFGEFLSCAAGNLLIIDYHKCLRLYTTILTKINWLCSVVTRITVGRAFTKF